MWDKIINILPDFVKGIFSTVDQLVVDKDAANQIKLEILTTIAGKDATSWLTQNAFPLAMLVNFGLVVVLSLLNRDVPEWALIVALAWLAGPLLNVLSKETISKIIEFSKGFKDEQRKRNEAGDHSSAQKTGG